MRCPKHYYNDKSEVEMELLEDRLVCPECGYSLINTPTLPLTRGLEVIVMRVYHD